MYVSKTYSLSLETVELIASLANDYGSQRKVIEMAVTALAGEPLPETPARRTVMPRSVGGGTVPHVEHVNSTPVAVVPTRRESFAEQKRRTKVADAVAAKVCPDCGDQLPWCGCDVQAEDVRRACEAAGWMKE